MSSTTDNNRSATRKSTTGRHTGRAGMTRAQLGALRQLEGRQVSVALADGSRLDDCQLVAAARNRVRSLWLFTEGEDVFVPTDEVRDVWEVRAA